MTLKERMFYLIEKEGLNPNQFYTISGLGNGYLNNVGESFRKPTIEKIQKNFPHWNMDWILYEKGEPISNISKENIAASIFHAVAVQTTVTLARGCNIVAPVLLCGCPLTFIPALRKAFANYLNLSQDTDFILPEKGNLIPAWGAALAENNEESISSRINSSHGNVLDGWMRK